jgi:hypothetical protein
LIEDALWDHEASAATPPHFTDEGFRAALKIFMAAALDKMWTLQRVEVMPLQDRAAMAEALGNEVRRVVKTYLDIDSRELYKPAKSTV